MKNTLPPIPQAPGTITCFNSRFAICRVFVVGLFFTFYAQTVAAQSWIEAADKAGNFFTVRDSFEKEWEGREYERGRGYKQYQRWANFMQKRMSPDGAFPDPAAAWKGYLDFKNKNGGAEKSSLLPPLTWTPLGPTDWEVGSQPITPGNGRLNVIVQDPVDANKIYVGASSGGLWRSTNGGTTWTPLTDGIPAMGVSGIAIDPTNTNVIYIGTGDGDGSDTYSVGVLKSTDGGATWNTTGLSFNVPDLRSVRKLLMHPTHPDTLFAATNIGVFKTTDAGANWTGVSTISAHDVEFHPTDPSIVYACSDEFFRSADGGNTFTLITSGLPAATTINRYRIGVSPDEPDWVYVLGGNQLSFNAFYGIYRSTDAGLNFSLRANSPNLFGYQPNGSDIGGQSQYDMALAVNPANADELWSGGINVWKSSDGGTSWVVQTQWTLPNNTTGYVHADVHELSMYGNNLYTGTDGGIFKSTNLGEDWTNLSVGLSIGQIYDIGGSPTNANLMLGGFQDNGTMVYSGTGDWTQVAGGDGITCAINPFNESIQYASTQGGVVYKSTNGGASFNSFVSYATIGSGESSVFETVFVLDPNDPNTLYLGYKSLFKSTDNGLTWTSLGIPGGNTGGINKIAVAPSNPNVIYVSKLGNVGIYKTTTGGGTWTNISAGLPGSIAFADIAVDPSNPDRLWVGFGGFTAASKIYRSDNGGANWTNVTANLPNLPVNTIAVQPNSNNILYVGMDVGIYSKDASQTNWTEVTGDLPNVIVNEIEINTGLNKLQIGTFGRGAWMADLPLPVYCQPVFTNNCGSGHQIEGVALGTIDNQATGCGTNNYSDFTNLSAALYANGSYPITLMAGAGGQGVYFAAMVDFNADKDFDDAGEFFPIGFANAGGMASGNITVPATVFVGTTRLRILCRDGNTPITQGEICGTFAFGEAEDYSIVFEKPACVTLTTPLAGATGVAVSTDLSWMAAGNNATGYRLDVGTTPGGTQILGNVDVGNITTYNPANDLPFSATIYVQIKPYNVNGTNWACPDESFQTLILPPNCTAISNPANGATNVSIFSAITWTAATGVPTGYRMNVGTTPGGTDILNNYDAGNVTSYNPPGNFPYSTVIYVKIIPYNSAGEAIGCSEQSFTTQIAPPGCSDLLDPLHLATNVPVTTALTWAVATGAPTGYRLRIGTTSGGSQILNNIDVGNVTTYDPPGDLPYGTLLYVGITPYNGTGNASGCTQKLFTTAPAPPACTSLSSPANGATGVTVTTALTWAAATGSPSGYRLDVGTTPGGTDILNSFDVGNVLTYDPPGAFPANTTIYVKITPYNGGGNAVGCTVQGFTTQSCIPNLTLDNLTIATGTYPSLGELTASLASILNGSTVTFKSDTAVLLQQDFTVELGGVLDVLIEACPANLGALVPIKQ